jgi:hypothetical protein
VPALVKRRGDASLQSNLAGINSNYRVSTAAPRGGLLYLSLSS